MKLPFIAISALATATIAATCNYDRAIRAFENRMEFRKAVKTEKSVGDGVARVQKIYPKIKKGQFTGMTQFAVYGFIGCDLKAVRLGKYKGDDHEIVGIGTAYMRGDGSLKAICTGSFGVLLPVGHEPNTSCSCYDENSLPKDWSAKSGCADLEDYDGSRMVLDDEYIEFRDPAEADQSDAIPAGDPSFADAKVTLVERDSYFDAGDTGTRKPKAVWKAVKKGMKDITEAVSGFASENRAGAVTLKLVIGADGEVSAVYKLSSTVPSQDAADAVVSAAMGMKFAKADGETVVIVRIKIE